MSTSPGLTFLSWYREALAAGMNAASGGSKLDVQMPAQGTFSVNVSINDTSVATFSALLHSPGDVAGCDSNQVIRTMPPEGATNVETSFFPFIEFVRPDLPWMLTPNIPQRNKTTDSDPRRGLHPWLVLVVIPADSATIIPPSGNTGTPSNVHLPILQTTSDQLPELSESWLWVHAQVLTTGDASETIDGIIASEPQRAMSRLIAPRRLRPNTAYVACVVPAFDAGRDAELGRSPSNSVLGPAWQAGQGNVELPVYYSWRFRTGAPGSDFLTLARLLTPYDGSGAGVRPIDVGQAGSGMPGPGPGDPAWLLNLEGALVGGNVPIGQWSPSVPESTFKSALAAQLDGTSGELSPPTYGSTQAGFRGSLSGGQGPAWLRTLNLDPRYRVAAAIGTAVVQRYEEALMASAWQQAGELRKANQILARGQLARETNNRIYQKRIGTPSGNPPLDDNRLMQISTAVHSQIAAPASEGSGSIAIIVSQNSSLKAAINIPFRRTTRPLGPLAKRTAPGPLPSPVAPIADASIRVSPELQPVSGQLSVEEISQTESLSKITPARVSTPVFPWETPAASIKKTVARKKFGKASAAPVLAIPYGFMSDVLITTWQSNFWYGRALDFNAVPGLGWEPLPYYLAGKIWAVLPPTSGQLAGTYVDFAGRNGLITFTAETQYVSGLGGLVVTGYYNWLPGYPLDGTLSQSGYGGLGDKPPVISNGSLVTHAVAATDLTGSGNIDVIFVWTAAAASGTHTYLMVGRGLDTSGEIMVGWTTPQAIGGYLGPLSVAAMGRQVCVLGSSGLLVLSLDSTGKVVSQVMSTGFYVPRDFRVGSIAAAAFGSAGMDLLFCYSAGPDGQLRGGYNLVLDVRPDGTIGSFGDELPLPIPDPPMNLLLGVMTKLSAFARTQQTQGFRLAAARTQTRQQRVLSAAGPPPPQPKVPIAPLAQQIRAAIDPKITVPPTVLSRLQLPSTINAAVVSDVLQAAVCAPYFPEPTYEAYRDLQPDRFLPGSSSMPDNRAVLLKADSNMIEAFLIGLSAEMAHTLLWHGFPGDLHATYFDRFWDSRDQAGAVLKDITPIGGWDSMSALGNHAPAGDNSGLLVLVLRGELLRRFPHVAIYAAPAKVSGNNRSPDISGRADPVFTGRLNPDIVLLGFNLDPGQVRGDGGTPGWYFVLQEHPTAPRFGLKEPPPGNSKYGSRPSHWRDLDWSQVVASQTDYDALAYITIAKNPLGGVSLTDDGSGKQHLFGFSAAHMAHIMLQPAVQVAIHGSLLLAPSAS